MELESAHGLPLGQAGQLLSKDLAEVIARFDSDQAAEAVFEAPPFFNDAYPQFEGERTSSISVSTAAVRSASSLPPGIGWTSRLRSGRSEPHPHPRLALRLYAGARAGAEPT